MASFGAPRGLVGVLVGLTPFFSGLAQPFLMPVFKKLKLKTVLLIFCSVNILASIMYALGSLSTSVATVLVARCLMGMVGGPAICSTFVVRAAGLKVRSICMQRVGIGIGLGYAIGPLLGVAVKAVCTAAGWTSRAINAMTAPGWVMCMLFLVEMALIAVCFQEPKSGGPPPSKGPPPPLPKARLALAYAIVFIAPINVGLWDVNTVFRTQEYWGWTIDQTGLFLGGINLAIVPLMLLPVTKHLSDRVGMVAFAALAALSSVFFFEYDASLPKVAAVVLYVLGSLTLLFAASIIKAFAWGHVSKLPPTIPQKQLIMSTNSAIYMFGRGTGAVLGPAFHNESWFATIILILDAVAVLGMLAGWKLLTLPPAA